MSDIWKVAVVSSVAALIAFALHAYVLPWHLRRSVSRRAVDLRPAQLEAPDLPLSTEVRARLGDLPDGSMSITKGTQP